MENASSDSAVPVVVLPETLDLAAAEGLLSALRDNVRPGVECRLDAAAVRVLTTPCAQILIAAAKNCAELVIENPSPEFTEAVTDLGIEEHVWRRV